MLFGECVAYRDEHSMCFVSRIANQHTDFGRMHVASRNPHENGAKIASSTYLLLMSWCWRHWHFKWITSHLFILIRVIGIHPFVWVFHFYRCCCRRPRLLAFLEWQSFFFLCAVYLCVTSLQAMHAVIKIVHTTIPFFSLLSLELKMREKRRKKSETRIRCRMSVGERMQTWTIWHTFPLFAWMWNTMRNDCFVSCHLKRKFYTEYIGASLTRIGVLTSVLRSAKHTENMYQICKYRH